MNIPTHRCKNCNALWVLHTDNSWSLVSPVAGKCCDNTPMGEQIETLDSALACSSRQLGEALHTLGTMQNERDSYAAHIAKESRLSDSEMMVLLRRVNKEFENEIADLRARATRWQSVAEEQHEALVLCNMVPPTISKVLIERALASFTLAAEEGK